MIVESFDLGCKVASSYVEHAIGIQDMPFLGCLGACPSRKILKTRCSEIEF